MAYNFPKKTVLEAVSKSRGIVSVVARSLGCDWITARRYIDMYPEAQQLMNSERETLVDTAESVLVKCMSADDERVRLSACQFALERLGKSRGYSNRQEFDLSSRDGSMSPSRIEIVAPKD